MENEMKRAVRLLEGAGFARAHEVAAEIARLSATISPETRDSTTNWFRNLVDHVAARTAMIVRFPR